MSMNRCNEHDKIWDTDYFIECPLCQQEACAYMDDMMIHMKKSKSTKRFDVFEAEKSDAHITSIYINKAANAPEVITVVVGDRK